MHALEKVDFPDTVLVVDDEPIVVDVLERILPMRGLSVVSVGSGEQASDLMKRQRFGCLLADKNLPGKDGMALIAEARKVQPHCARIVMTAYASTSSAVEALRLGAHDYLEKPFQDIELLAEKVRLAIAHQRAEFDRVRFLKRLGEFQAELTRKSSQVDEQRSEIEAFNAVLEERVQQATADLRKERDQLLSALGSGVQRPEAEIVGAEIALGHLQDLAARPGPEMAPVRGELQRVIRQLEAHISRLRGSQAA
ncbi:MAG TPA: response regulator [Myxococcales bacterium]|nr:response regulator [Myxococcales bacterium]